VDRDNETHEVLETVLARQGVSTLRACGARAGLRLVRECHPDVVVVDLDTAGDDPSDVGCEALQEAVHREAISLVLVGTHRGARP
jgi:CheY-like chemotaxis protein